MSTIPSAQLGPLVSLRWRMVRTRRARIGLGFAAALLPLLVVAAIAFGVLAPRTFPVDQVLIVTPTLLLAFLVLSVTAPLAAGGGVELFPSEQLVGFPIRPRTIYAGSLLLAPLNLAWLLQVLLALTLITYVTSGAITARLATAFTIATYLVMVTLLGQAVAWTVVGVRRTRNGRAGAWLLLGMIGLLLLWLVRTDRFTDVLDRSPTVWVVVGALAPSDGEWSVWVGRTLVLVVGIVFSILIGIRACGWALKRPGDGGSVREDRPVVRHEPAQATSRGLLLRLDRMAVWRTPALRRGSLVLGLLPAAVIALTRADWSTLVLLPGLVSAGAGLLFAVNAFCLDASGSIWMASLPLEDRVVFNTRAATVAGSVLIPVTLALAVGVTRVSSPWSWTQLLGVAAAAVSSATAVTALCMRWSVRKPHRADLRGPRDTPAPPGAMAIYAVKLSGATTSIGVFLSILALIGNPVLIALGAAMIVALGVRSLGTTRRRFTASGGRAQVVASVSGG